jgi:hypothetical protein
MTGSFESGKESSGSLKSREFLDQIRDYQHQGLCCLKLGTYMRDDVNLRNLQSVLS